MILSLKDNKQTPAEVMKGYYKSIDPLSIEDIEMMQKTSNNIWMVKNDPEGLKGIKNEKDYNYIR